MENSIANLTESEIQLIKTQREKAELEAKEKLQRQQVETEKEITRKKVEITDFINHWKQQNNQALFYLHELQQIDANFVAVTKEQSKTFEVSHYDYSDSKKSTKVIDWSEEVNYNNITIVHSLIENKTIIVEEHKSQSGSLYSGRKTNHGFKMKIEYGDNRYTKDPKNMADKFTDILTERRNKIATENNQKNAQEQALIALQDKYPSAVIEHKSEHVSGHHSSTGRLISNGYTRTYYKIMFPNGYGIKVSYKLYNNSLELTYDGTIMPDIKFNLKDDAINNYINAISKIG